MRDLAVDDLERPVAFLFTGAEEQGLLGARAFVDWAGQSGLGVAEVINLDMIGRDRLAVRPEALPGFYFRLPVVGEVVFDGSRLRRGWPYEQPDAALVARLQRVAGDDLVVYRRVTAHSDGGVFQAAGLPVVSLSSDNAYYLNRVWERDADRVELLDEVHLEMVRRTVVDYVLREWDGE
jgi:Zn-dependent M28 family amino/carboxypeptidase